MSQSNSVTGAHSEDGNAITRNRQTEDDLVEHPIARGRPNRDDASLSMTAELSNHGREEQHNQHEREQPISEQ
jgi:hypothetical protein